MTPGGRSAIVKAALARPDLWWTGLGAVRRLAAPGWWRSPPHLPVPDQGLWAFRMITAYGSPDADPEAADMISYLEWCRSTARHRRGDRRRKATCSPPGHQDAAYSG